ncbi:MULTISPECIES: formylglycine-generating enzyme family protein [unclassified Nitrobacter]|uniref:formylglycine-generating enzyme family protein n=1 Tax=unclassified Nitrobacter TaxID=2620411 RepID=UPI000927F453|nr:MULTISPECIES: formylglycine-generating enzyme family protein [unclassified Nitrobacter]MBN9149338.1 formylglycine-generating enzyme family protein [Nitrobacter sp.]OJV01570.1 MAG: hypothetical protein BGO16_17060 [Nitrobacter sp. 62-23]
MSKFTALLALLTLIVGVNISATGRASAEGCQDLQFFPGKDGLLLTGIAPAEGVTCYRLATEIGQEFTLKILGGDNTVFSILDVADAQDRFTFTAQRTDYEVRVGQLMRSAGPENFRISIQRRRGEQAAQATAPDAARQLGTPMQAGTVTKVAGSAAAVGQPFRDCANCPEMMPLPLGSFMMGASPKEVQQLKYADWSVPQHRVTIGYPFAIGRFEVTVDEFGAYVKETGAHVGGKCGIRVMESGPHAFKYTGTPVPGGDKTKSAPYVIYIGDGSYAQPGLPVTGRQPAVCVSRNEMKGYLDWLSTKTGKHYRLPTEAEWEYAYRAGTETFSFWGNDFKSTCDYANFADRKSGYQAALAAACAEKIHPDWTAEVGSYKPNPWGLYDMGGNAQETVEDCFHKSYQGAPPDGSPWNEADCVVFVARSGDYELTQLSMRASERLIFGYDREGNDGMWSPQESSDERFNVMGFRVAVSLDGTGWDKTTRASQNEQPSNVRQVAAELPMATTDAQYQHLPAAVRAYAETVRNSCKEYNSEGVPTDRMAGITSVTLDHGRPALILDNETLCADHYTGANCSNRGCDAVIMIQGDGAGWKEIFHEHLYEKTFNISADKKLTSITARIYAGDPHCAPRRGSKLMSSDSCAVEIRYRNNDWIWRKTSGLRQGSADAPPRSSQQSASAAASPPAEWPVFVSHDPERVSTQHKATAGRAFLTMACNTALGPGTGASLYDYKGNALERADGVDRPGRLIVTLQDGRTIPFLTSIRYYAPDKAWIVAEALPAAFLDVLPGSASLSIENSRAEKAVDFDLRGSENFGRKALEVCAGRSQVAPVPDPHAPSGTKAGQCEGLYTYFNVNDTSHLVPIMDRRIDRREIDNNPENASWYDVACDTAGRPTIVKRYAFNRLEYTNSYEYVRTSTYLAKITTRNPDDSIRSITLISRNGHNQPARVEIVSAAGKIERFGEYKYSDDRQIFRIVNALTGAQIFEVEKQHFPDGRLRFAKWHYPKQGYDYLYDHDTDLVADQTKFNDTGPFEKTQYEYDTFGNTLKRTGRCFAPQCDTLQTEGFFTFGLLTKETALKKTGERLSWANEYNQARRLVTSTLAVNDRFAVKFVVEMSGDTVVRTVAYAPDQRVLFIYHDRAVVYINRNGSPVDGGRFERVSGVDAW